MSGPEPVGSGPTGAPGDSPDVAPTSVDAGDAARTGGAPPPDPARSAGTDASGGEQRPQPSLRERSVACRLRYRESRNPDDINAAVHFARQAVAEAADGPGRAAALADLANALRVRFTATGAPNRTDDIDEAVLAAEEAVEIAAQRRQPRPVFWSVLALARRARFQSTWQTTDIDRAVTAAQNAADLGSMGAPDAARLAVLSTNLRLRYQHCGQLSDANRAVDAAERAVACTPDGPGKAARWTALAAARGTRYRGTRQLEDIDRCVTAARATLHLPDPLVRNRRVRWANLAVALRIRAERTHDPQDLRDAVTAARTALVLTGRHEPQRPLIVAGLASAFGTKYRYELVPDRADIDEAITLTNLILDDASAPPTVTADRRGNLAAFLRIRALQERTEDDAAQAVAQARQALASVTGTGRAAGALLWTTLASAHEISHELTSEAAEADRAIGAYLHAVDAPGSPAQRAFAAYWAGKLAYSIGAHETAAAAFDLGVDLLPSIAWPGLSRASREDALRRYQVLAGAAAAARLEAGDAVAAAAASERGRGVMWAASLSVRSDFSQLAATRADLAAQLTQLASHLTRAEVGTQGVPLT